ncbi:DUF4406 domain-containing protein [Cellulosimicrobium cellulans]|uniref:dATP/dGTP diphosphohydrolase domain-containing protein n=1 Tax=Cellulosimicrobium cellulans TaxID=1710 RepID=UPI0019645FD9|nr:dATP/dGTP diphosphohydrolase domain-containing protein [Cellulosimicrobium cellulans]MBN0040221.1 DUF4406 domain-containing protein [Cellulosimicrobium cellulans]
MRVYVAGPMRRLPEFNFPAFDNAANALRGLGYDVVNPAEHDRDNGFDPAGMTGHEDLTQHGFDLRAALAWDLEQITRCDAVFLLDGWQQSSGARAEYALAQALGLFVTSEQAWADSTIIPRPWFKTALFEERGYGPTAQTAPAPSTSGEVRVTSTTGGQKGSKPERYDLIPALPLRQLARLYGKGSEKYEDRNWERGFDWSLSFAALNRHLWQWWDGRDGTDVDDETGLSHMASVAWHAFTLLHFEHYARYAGFDNRPGGYDPEPTPAASGGAYVGKPYLLWAKPDGCFTDLTRKDDTVYSEAQEAGDAA